MGNILECGLTFEIGGTEEIFLKDFLVSVSECLKNLKKMLSL